MKQDEFISGLDDRIREIRQYNLGGRGSVEIAFPGHYRAGRQFFSVKVPTKGTTTVAALKAVNGAADEIIEAAEVARDAERKWAKTPAGRKTLEDNADRSIQKARETKAITLAEETGRLVDEHGSTYGRGDHFRVNVYDVVDDPIKYRRFHGVSMLAVVGQERTRTYAKSYSYGPSVREDLFLVGRNETGVSFAHAVPTGLETVEDAVLWIWDIENVDDLADRHGDVGVIRSARQFKSPGEFGEVRVLDSHIFSGEFRKNGALYVRNGVLRHTKDQHPDIKIGKEWVRLKVARRSERKVSISSHD